MKYRIDDETIVDTDQAQTSWKERTRWDGNNHISVNTDSQWKHETLYLSGKGRYYLVHSSNYGTTLPSATWVEPEAAARWLLFNEHPLPDDLAEFESQIIE